MAGKREFTDHERYAVFTAHGERCYLCRRPLDLQTMEVDHVLPEQLLSEPGRLATVLAHFGLPSTFEIQSLVNWLPSCRPCNNRKRAQVFEPVPAVLLELNEAGRKKSSGTRKAVGH